MPFNFLRRRGEEPPPGAPKDATAEPIRSTSFGAFTEDWHIVAALRLEGRLSDVLNRREAIEIAEVGWAPIDGSAPLAPAPQLRVVDPYDLILVVAGSDSLPPLSAEERAAHRIHKVPYDVLLEAPPFRIVGTVAMRPGADPGRLLDRSTELFFPVLDAFVLLGDVPIGDLDQEVVMVNRSYVRSVEPVDRAAARAQLMRDTQRP